VHEEYSGSEEVVEWPQPLLKFEIIDQTGGITLERDNIELENAELSMEKNVSEEVLDTFVYDAELSRCEEVMDVHGHDEEMSSMEWKIFEKNEGHSSSEEELDMCGKDLEWCNIGFEFGKVYLVLNIGEEVTEVTDIEEDTDTECENKQLETGGIHKGRKRKRKTKWNGKKSKKLVLKN
jgi:hypothetical protein